jgi:membrane-associated phospholipid phosphatase
MEKDTASEDTPTQKGGAALVVLVRKLRHAGVSRAKALHAALGLSLLIGLVVSVLLLWGFFQLSGAVLAGETVAFDHAVLNWMNTHRTPWLDASAIEATALGSMVVLAVIGLALSVILWHLEKHRHVAMIWFAVTGSLVMNQVLKTIFGRGRPDVFEPLVKVGSLSFPSGHAMNSMVFYTAVGFAIGHVVGPGRTRKLVYAFAACLVALVGFTRVYLGVHYPSDVLAGFAAGCSWALVCAALTEAWGKRAAATDTPRA